MKVRSRRFPVKRLRLLVTIPAIGAYILSLSGWYISPDFWFLPSLISPGFIWAWFFLCLLIIFWLGKKNRALQLFLIFLMVAGLPPMAVSFSVGKNRSMIISREQNTLRVMQWNCMNLPGNDPANQSFQKERRLAFNFIDKYQPDIICLQDFAEIKFRTIYSNMALLRDSLGYAWEHVVPYGTELKKYGFVTSSTAIYSKKPFLNKGALFYTNSHFPEAIVWVDINLENQPVRIVTTHFASMHLSSHKIMNPARLPYFLRVDSSIIMSQNLFTKLNFFLKKHREQARFLRNFLDTCPIPVILAADLNTVPANYLYKQVKGEMEDGFIGSKTGMGSTYNYLAPNIRIDYLLNDRKLKPLAFQHFENGFFDHDHLLADYTWRKP